MPTLNRCVDDLTIFDRALAPAEIAQVYDNGLTGANTYTYDANGNQTLRTSEGVTYVQEFNAENKLAKVTNQTTGEVTKFTYDGNGARVQKDVDGTITTYVGGYYEVQGSVETSYYYAAGQRVAMRKDGEVTYLHSDHLGSTSLTTNGAGGFEARVLYYPYGEERYVEGTLQTDFGYTGQRKDSYTQLIEMGARWYDPKLARWASADTIVPGFANPQSLNRFAYAYNNPVKYVDPTGHIANKPNEIDRANGIVSTLSAYGVTIDVDWGWDGNTWNEGSWTLQELILVFQGVYDLAAAISGELNNGVSNEQNFRDAVGPVTIRRVQEWNSCGAACTLWNTITMYNGAFAGSLAYSRRAVVHELAHVWDFEHGPIAICSGLGLEVYAGSSERRPTDYSEENYAEYWAETVESWVYGVHPDEVKNGRNPNLGPLHVEYIGLAIRGQHVPYYTTKRAAAIGKAAYWGAAESAFQLSVIGSYYILGADLTRQIYQ